MNELMLIDKNTGEIIDDKSVDEYMVEYRKAEINRIFIKYKHERDDMTPDEYEKMISCIRRKRGGLRNYYNKGGFHGMQNLDDYNDISIECEGLISRLMRIANKSGVIIYGNNKPIRSFERVRLRLEIGERVWSRLKKELNKYGILLKVKYKGDSIIVLNPKYVTKCAEVTEVKFIFFHKFWKEVLDEMTYDYLCCLYEYRE